MTSHNIITITDSSLINVTAEDAYRMLIEPSEQMKWNSLYLKANVEPRGEIKAGTIMKVSAKDSGKRTIIFEGVIPGKEFSHCFRLMIANLILLGELCHKYEVVERDGQTVFTQTVTVRPRGIGKLFEQLIVSSFRKRLPESSGEFRVYAEQKMQHPL